MQNNNTSEKKYTALAAFQSAECGANADETRRAVDANLREESPLLVVNTKLQSDLPLTIGFSQDDLMVYKRARRWDRKAAVEKLLAGERVAKCYAVRIKPSVEVRRVEKIKRASYAGLLICGRVWKCPICAAKITERRRLELEGANFGDLFSFMVSVTFQHNSKDNLADLVRDLDLAWMNLRAGYGWQEIKKKFGIVGSVTGREITYGLENGWHPHLHVLFVSNLKLDKKDLTELEKYLYDRFAVELKKLHRYASPEHGIKVSSGDDLNKLYIAKVGLEEEKKTSWNLISEVTKSSAKSGMIRGSHYSPFQLLDLYLVGDRAAGRRFVEYANAMSGKQSLWYSKRLRKILGLDVELSDLEVAELQDQDAILFASLDPELWKKVLKFGKRSSVLEVASSGDHELFEIYCKTIMNLGGDA